jgi:uncharacterized membrane protein YgcG
MNKKLSLVMATGFAVATMFTTSCSKTKVEPVQQTLNATPATKKGLVASSTVYSAYSGATACSTQVATLFAGQTMNAGTVTVVNTADSVFVTYQTSGNWKIEQIHLYIGTLAGVPLSGGGNPKNGLFATAGTFSTPITTVTYGFLASALPSTFIVAAHSVVSEYSNGSKSNTQTGWADGTDFSGANWATYITFTKGSCAGSGSGGDGGSGSGGGDNKAGGGI